MVRKIERKLSSYMKAYQNILTFWALPFILVGIFCHHVVVIPGIAVPCFLIATLLCAWPIVLRAWMALKWKTISIELLVTIAVTGALIIGEFSECAIVTFLFQFGNYLEARTLKKTRNAIKSLVDSAPQTAIRLEDGEQEEIDAEDVEIDDLLLVKEGAKVPVDGILTKGEGYFDESGITGESKPVHKGEGEFVYAGSILSAGLVQMTATRVGEDTTYAKIIELVEEAEDAKSPVERFIDRFAKYYTPFVIVAAALTFTATRDVDTSVTVLVLACPGALVIGAPIASVSGIGQGAKKGILFKGGDVMHTWAHCDTFLMDKTGTLTYGDTRVASVKVWDACEFAQMEAGDSDARLLYYAGIAASMEAGGTHPLGKAILAHGKEIGAEIVAMESQVVKGKGMKAVRIMPAQPWDADREKMISQLEDLEKETKFVLGNEALLLEEGVEFTDGQQDYIRKVRDRGESLVLLVENQKLVLCYGIADTLRAGAREALEKLGNKRLIMLTGDHEATAKQIAEQAGIPEVKANLLPEEKHAYLVQCQEAGHKVCFIGDGLNDSPSIMKADTGIAMGSGTDVAIECSDIVILNSDITMLPVAHKLARKTVLITNENIVIAVGTVVMLLIGLFQGFIHMSSGMLIHELSILAVIFNGMRLLVDRKEE